MCCKPKLHRFQNNSSLFLLLLFSVISCSLPIQAAEKKIEKEVMLGTFLKFNGLNNEKDSIAKKKEAIQNCLAEIQANGLNTVMPYIIGSSGQPMYSSQIVPMPSRNNDSKPEWDPLKFVIEEAPKYRLKVYPTICVLVCGHHHLRGILKVHPEWALRNPEDKKLGFISCANPEARKWIVSVLKEITEKYQPDGLMLDYLRFNNRPMKLDPTSQKRFDSQFGTLDEKPRKEAMQTFKENSLTELTRMISEEVRPLKKGIQISIYSWGAHVSNNHRVAQNWKRWIKNNYIDMVCASGYVFEENYGPDFLSVFQKRMEAAQKMRQNSNPSTTLTFCLGLKTSHGKVKQHKEIKEYLSIATQAGIDGVVLFHWDGYRPFQKEVTTLHYFENYAKEIKLRNKN